MVQSRVQSPAFALTHTIATSPLLVDETRWRKFGIYKGHSPGEKTSNNNKNVAIETLGAIGPRSMLFLRDLGRRIALESGEPRSTDYLLQRLSVAVQRGNAAPVRGGMSP